MSHYGTALAGWRTPVFMGRASTPAGGLQTPFSHRSQSEIPGPRARLHAVPDRRRRNPGIQETMARRSLAPELARCVEKAFGTDMLRLFDTQLAVGLGDTIKSMSTATLLTVEQFEHLPDNGARYELKDGELVKMAGAKFGHDQTKSEILSCLVP